MCSSQTSSTVELDCYLLCKTLGLSFQKINLVLKSSPSLGSQNNKDNLGAAVRRLLGNLALDKWLPVCPRVWLAGSARTQQQ